MEYNAIHVAMVVIKSRRKHRLAWLGPEAGFRITVTFGEKPAWGLLIFIALSLCRAAFYRLLVRRDMGAGFIAQRAGSADASPRFNSPMALAWRQQKGGILVWAIGMAWLGGIMGIGTPNVSEAISSTFAHMDTAWASAIVKLGNQEGFIAMLIYILGLMAGLSVFAITAVQRLRQEEKEHYAEMVLSRPVSRVKWMGSYLTVAFAGSVLILLALGLASGLGWSIAAGDFSHFLRVLGMSLSKIPSVWTFIASPLAYAAAPIGFRSHLEHIGRVHLHRMLGGRNRRMVSKAMDTFDKPITLYNDEISIAPLILLTIIAATL